MSFDLEDTESVIEVINGIHDAEELRQGMLILVQLRKAMNKQIATQQEVIGNLESQNTHYKKALHHATEILDMLKKHPELITQL